MVRWVRNFGHEERISLEELRTSLELIIMTECLQGRRQWFGHAEKNERILQSRNCRTLKINDGFTIRKPRKT